MADLNANIKQRVFKSITFRFPGSLRYDNHLEVITELPENGENVQHRPLPLLPCDDKDNLLQFSWFQSVDRRRGEELISKGGDGCFIVRPSSRGKNYLTLTLWFQSRHYNIPIRRRTDGRYSLGSPKEYEQSFFSIEDMIKYYHKEPIILHTNNNQSGSTCLTSHQLS